MEFNPLECKICCNEFNEDHCPRILPCSHSFCGHCIEKLISTQKKGCPNCRMEFTANSAEDLMMNRDLLDAAKQRSSTDGESDTTSTGPKKSFLETTEYFRENVTGKGITVCQETEAEVKVHIESNNVIRKGLEGFIQTLEEIKLSSERILTNVDQNNKELMNKLDIMQQEQQNMKESERKLETATDFISAAPIMDGAEKVLHDVEKTVGETKQLIQENDRQKDDMRQDTRKIEMGLETAMKDLGRIIEDLKGETVVNITVHDFQSFCGCLKRDVQRGIFAVMTVEGKLRVAPIKIESNHQLYINHLEERRLPPRCFVIELESLMQGSPFPQRAFLDLAYESIHLGRIIIRVTDQGGYLGLNFIHMCLGDEGPSYANSQVSHVMKPVFGGEFVFMGQYYVSQGGETSTQAVLSSREEWERKRGSETYEATPWKAGDVRGDISYEKASQFRIATRDGKPIWGSGYCFGTVEEGLDVLRVAILKYPDITQVRVANCGIIL
ncbi:uncharacterized protein [Macrobrachium rosenbergii]|uniref:uncharacterized protein n=1 Tax=Macrobrachium rosenbergii TaxID=79674 RepID=UPI0034D5B4A7